MKYLSILILSFLLLTACKTEKKEPVEKEKTAKEIPPMEAMMESAVIYEANIRQYSEEGNFASFTKDIPEIKKLGVKIIWLMPIHPISEKNRKAKGDLMVHDIKDEEERKKYLGSHYAVADYKGINPDYGTKEDFQNLVDTAHKNGMIVILDWVANHTGWDHAWVTDHPEYYTKNDKGEIIDPIDPNTGKSWGWTDVADLNYDNKEMWDKMANDMVFWLKEFDVDGFRCDVAGEVPDAFWEFAEEKLESVKPIFMLAESEKRSLFHKVFDMGYNWEGHHIMNSIAQGHKNGDDWNTYMKKVDKTYQEDDFLMNFVTNHDENSWNGTVEERMGSTREAMLAFSYIIPGMPLIYSGQEYDLSHRLKFFEKDQIPKTKGKAWPPLEKLGKLKNENVALHGGKKAASYMNIDTGNNKVIAFTRSKDGKNVTYVGNFSKETVEVKLPIEGIGLDYMANLKAKLNTSLNLRPNDYKIFVH